MKVIIDRFEGEYAVVEIDSNNYVNLPRVLVPNSKEGDIVLIEVKKEESKNRKEHIQKLMNDVFSD